MPCGSVTERAREAENDAAQVEPHRPRKAGKQQPSQPDGLGAVMLFLHDLAKSFARKIGLAIA